MMQLDMKQLTGDVSVKGMLKLERILHEEAIRQGCIFAARRIIGPLRQKDLPWCIVQVWPGREHSVEKSLRDDGIDACVITCMGPKRRRHHKELPPSSKPVFIGYVFVRLAPSAHAMQALFGYEQVRHVVGGWESPYLLSEEVINDFKGKAIAGDYDWERPKRVAPAISNGDRVKVIDGPFTGFAGVVVAAGGENPVIEIDIFGRMTPLILSLDMIEKL